MNYAPLHNHTEYSALDGLSTCREIMERCKCIGCTSVGITDHGTVSGHLEFAKVAAEYDIKPVFGCELYHGVKTEFAKNERDQYHLVAGALTDEGLRNLWRMVDAASANFRYVGRVNWDILDRYKEGVFITSACIQGLVPRSIAQSDYTALNKYMEIFGDNFYIELHTYPVDDQKELNLWLSQTAQERGIPVVYATDAHFASPEDYEIHDAYVAMQTGETILMDPEDRKMWHPKALYMMDESEIRANLDYLPESVVDEALANTAAIAEQVNASLPEVRRHLPTFIPSECPWVDKKEAPPTAGEMFITLVEDGLVGRYGEDAPEQVWERAEREMKVFLDAGLEHYFLQAWDFCRFCDENNIKRGPGRGSAGGAIVSYALGITDVDPLYYDLIFERFYNPGREKGFPDIDNDFPQKDRKRVRQYLKDRWGADKVRTIGTIMRLKPKAAIDKTFKVCGITFEEKEALKRIVDDVPDIDILGPDSIGWDAEIDPGKTIYVMHPTPQADHNTGDRVEEWAVKPEVKDESKLTNEDRRRMFLELLRVVCSRVSGYGIHPSGTVVSDVRLDDELPCMWNASQKEQVTCFPMDDVDLRQFVKQDLLGLRNLDTLDDWESQILAQMELEGKGFEWSGLERQEHPEEMWEMLDQGLTLGIFQIEDGYARHLCKELKPRSVEDLGAIVALNRPGPIRSGAVEHFIARRHGAEPISYDHPILEDILEPTYGDFLYQEQVIRFFQKIGLNASDGDAVRKILGKKKPEEMQKLKNGEGEWEGKGYFHLCEESGIEVDAAQTIWAKLEEFAKYSFNKSHAIQYAVIAFRTLYAKYYGTSEMYIASIRTLNESKDSDKAEKIAALVMEARRLDILVGAPDIMRSEVDVAVSDDREAFFGFSNIKGIGKGSAQYVIDLRDRYGDRLMSPEGLSDALEEEQVVWEAKRDAAKAEGKPFKAKSPRQQFRQNQIALLYEAGAWDMYEDRGLSLTEIQKKQKELLGVIISDNAPEVIAANASTIEACDNYVDLLQSPNGEKYRVPGVISKITPKKTKKDSKAMGIVTIEFSGEQVEFVVFPKQWSSYKFLWTERTVGVFTLKHNERGIQFEDAIKLTV